MGLAELFINTYPHELDGGRRRIGIARALAMEPRFIVCDEPVSAWTFHTGADTEPAQGAAARLGLTYVLSRDLSVVNLPTTSSSWQIVEKAPADELFENPLHPYTQALLSAILIPAVGANRERIKLRGELASPIDPPPVCRFDKRCNYYCQDCDNGVPPLLEITPGHFVACHLVKPRGNATVKAS